MEKRIIQLKRDQSLGNIYDQNKGEIEESEEPDFEEELILEYKEDGRE